MDGRDKEMKKITVFDVADYFLSCVDVDAGSVMTNLKLQKLCYYAQAWNLVFNGEPLFDEKFEAWIHGPACPSLWRKYKRYGWKAIPQIVGVDSSIFKKEQLETLGAVWEAYGQFDGKYLEELVHREDPWVDARRGFDSGEICDNVIPLEAMKNYYHKVQYG